MQNVDLTVSVPQSLVCDSWLHVALAVTNAIPKFLPGRIFILVVAAKAAV